MKPDTPTHNSHGLNPTHKSNTAYLSISQAAKYAGVSRSTMYRLIKSGSLTVHTPLPTIKRISVAQLAAVMERQA